MQNKKFFAIAILLAIVVSCKKKVVETDNLFKFRDYISYTTSGLTSVANPIKISLTEAVESWDVDKEIDKSLISISPYVEGQLKARNKHTLVFTPDENLDPSTEYTVTVKLGKIYDNIPSDYKNYTFQFKTLTPNFSVITNNLQSYSKDWQYIDGEIRSADVITLSDAKALISASQNNDDLSIVWNEVSGASKFFEFKVDSIHRTVNDGKITLKWNGKAIKADNEGESDITIPGKNNFTIVDVNVIQSPEQHLSINFSDPLKKQQNFDGLISIQNVSAPKYIVDGNVLKVYPNTRLTGSILVEAFQGILNTDDYKLKNAFSRTITFESQKPQVRLVNNGVILPNSEALRFNFEAVNLSHVDVRIIKIFEDNILQLLQDDNLSSNNDYSIKKVGRRIAKETITLVQNASENTGKWKAYSIDLSNYFKADPGAIYRVELSFDRSYSLYDCNLNSDDNSDEDYEEDTYYENDVASIEDEDLREEQYWDDLTYNYRNYRYNWRERDNPCHDAYYNRSKVVSQNLIASNLGVIAKRGSNNTYVFAVTDILTTNPESGASITLYNYQQQVLKKISTNAEGIAEVDIDKHAAFAIITKGKSNSYVKLKDGNALSLSKFDVSGKRLQRGLKGYLYGERGVWRPGDTLFLTFMLNDNANKLPKRHPVKLEITDPVGKLVHRKVSVDNINNVFAFKVPTSADYKTGNYNARVSVGGAVFNKNLKIETVKPNRLKIKVDFKDDILTHKSPLNGTLKVAWLHGAPAKNIKAEVKAKFTTSSTSFKNYKSYVFNDPTRKFNTEEINVFEGNIDAKGEAVINKNLSVSGNAPGMLNVQFLVRAFENGGDFSLDAFTKTYAPYESFVGLRSPEGNAYGSYFTGEDHTFDIATVDAYGKPVSRKDLEVKIYRIEWRWWWNSSYDDLSSYVSSSYHRPVQTLKVSTGANGKANFKLNIPDDDRGRYLIRILDPKSGHATGRTAYFYKNWWQNSPTGDKEAAKMLVFASDKENYNVGETAKITFPSASEGRALVSIENGSEVLSHQWVKTDKGETTVDIPITSEMAPNVFVNISLLQPHAISSNDLPIRLYGIIPLLVENPETKLQPVISMPDELKPKTNYTIKVSEKNNKPMTYTIAVVEEGLLDLTRFKTPNAWNSFYAREALGVRTWDVFDDVIGAYSGSIDQVFAIGGDGSAAKGKNKKANRFKPVVTYLGPFLLGKGETDTHNIKMPNYVGSVRAMVIAGDNTKAAYGSEEKAVPVKQPLMVLASLPRKLSPGEKVTLPVTVFAMKPKVKNVSLSLKLSDDISIVGNKTQSLRFDKPDEKMAYFELDVSKAKGVNTIEVIASGNGERSTYKVEIDVFNPNPTTSKYIDNTLQANATKTVSINTFGVPGSNAATVEFSTLPHMDFSGRMQYLIRYPHGCVEQTTSSVFPQLFLTDIFDLSDSRKIRIQNNIRRGISRLGRFQRPDGGLSYWIGENRANDWGTSYAGHFMLEAEKKGYVLPVSFKSNWIRYQQNQARNWRPSYRDYNSDLAQAYRLYTLALAGQPDLAAMNRLRAFSEISNEAKWRLAAAYALAGQTEASDAISKTANVNFEPKRYDYYTYGSVDRNRAMALETMVITKNPKTQDLARSIAKVLSGDGWMSTQSTAYSLLAMARLIEYNGGKAMQLSYSINGTTQTIDTKSTIALRDLDIKAGSNSLKITNLKDNVVYVRVLNSGKLPLGQELVAQRGLSVSVTYKDLNGNKIDISKLQQGQDFVATVSVKNQKSERVNDVALTQIFPSGWEIVNTRFTDFGDTTVSPARHTDLRDDRVNFYFDMDRNGRKGSTKTFTVMLNASYLGKYYLPGVQAEAMYDNDYLVRNKGQWIEVVK